ncbi:MAG: hypothetical protein HFG27_08515 [Provencibacterium sp.]|nr:hypothetical protein [Provencibacterium sp.]
MKPKKYFVKPREGDGPVSIEYACDEKEAAQKWAKRFNKKSSAAAATCISSTLKKEQIKGPGDVTGEAV